MKTLTTFLFLFITLNSFAQRIFPVQMIGEYICEQRYACASTFKVLIEADTTDSTRFFLTDSCPNFFGGRFNIPMTSMSNFNGSISPCHIQGQLFPSLDSIYAFRLTQGCGSGCTCILEYKCKKVLVTSLQEHNLLEAKLYPNPVKESLYIEGIEQSTFYRLHNLQGQLLQSGQVAHLNPIDLRHFAKGIYLLQLGEANNSVWRKVVKQ